MTPKAVLGFFVYLLLPPLVLFLLAGTIRWPMAWVYLVMANAAVIGSRLILLRRDPELLRERARSAQAEDAKDWDRPLALIVAVVGPMWSASRRIEGTPSSRRARMRGFDIRPTSAAWYPASPFQRCWRPPGRGSRPSWRRSP